jgi:hypothetical protein
MTAKNPELDRLLNFDPLAAAENFTGKSYSTDNETMALGFIAVQDSARDKKAALEELKDTYYSCPWSYASEIIEDLGFEQVLVRAFLAHGRTEYHVVYWHEDGMLMTAETYGGEKGTVNSISLYYNVEFADSKTSWEVTASGHFNREAYDAGRYVWIGNHQIHEGLRYKVERLKEVGNLLPVWIEDPYIFLDHYGDNNVSTEEVFALLPEKAKKAMAVVDFTTQKYTHFSK